MLDCGVSGGGSRYFKFENMWLKSEGFVEQVKTWWMSYSFQGSPSYVLACKLKALKSDLKKWNEEVFGNVGKKKKDLLDGIRELDIIAEGRPLTEDERLRKEDISKELERFILFEEVSWRQKSRALWLREGIKTLNFSTGWQILIEEITLWIL
jgi:hypothetical protein